MVLKVNYGQREVEAAASVLIELIHILDGFKDALVIVGGSVPPLLYPEAADEYIGTTDIDLAFNHNLIDMDTYQTILQILIDHGYKPDDKQPFIFYREVPMSGSSPIIVHVDLLSGEYGGTGKSHRTQKVQDLRARKARGSDLAFEQFKEVDIEGKLPGGGKDRVQFKITAVVPFIIMKGMAMAGRLKEKDAWDILFCLKHHPGGLKALVEEFRPYTTNKLVSEGLSKIAEKFASPEHIGPKHIADFEGIEDSEERERIQRDAYERIHYLLSNLGVIKSPG